MPISSQANAIKIINSWISRRSAVARLVQSVKVKPEFSYGRMYEPMERCTPEQAGIDSEYVECFYRDLMSEATLDMQTVTIARRGKILSEGVCFPYRTDIPHVSHSLCKSVVSLAIGVLYDKGSISLNEKIADIFPEKRSKMSVTFRSKLTVLHLLTMTSGAIFNEIGSTTDRDWLSGYLESGAKFTPGQQFEYNSMNTYVLSAIICRKTKRSLSDFIREYIFEPIGIKNFFWETCPLGIEKGGWGMYIYPEDVLKLGQLILDGGMCGEKRIISEKWIKLATKARIKTPAITGNYDYGFQMWVNDRHSEVLLNGMFGQNLHIFTHTKLLIMTTAGNGDIFQRCRSYHVIHKYFGRCFKPRSTLDPSVPKLTSLREYERMMFKRGTVEEAIVTGSFSDPREFKERTDKLSYITDRKEAVGVSIFPSIAQAVHNSFSGGIERISFSLENGAYYVTFRESSGSFKLKVGFDKAEYQTVYYNSEPYAIAVYGEAVTDEDKFDVLKLTLAYPELPNKKYFKIYFYDKALSIKCAETPGYEFAINALSMIAKNSIDENIIKTVGSKITKEVERKAAYFLKPTVHASLTM